MNGCTAQLGTVCTDPRCPVHQRALAPACRICGARPGEVSGNARCQARGCEPECPTCGTRL